MVNGVNSAMTVNLACGERGELLFVTWILFLVSPPPQMVRTTATDAARMRYQARVRRELEEVWLDWAVKDCVNDRVNSGVAIEAADLEARVISAGVVSTSSRHMYQLDFSKPLIGRTIRCGTAYSWLGS